VNRVEAELQPSGYLVGDRFSVADLTAAALLAPLVGPPGFPVAAPVLGPAGEFRDALAARVAFRVVGEMYRRHRGRSAEVRTPAAVPHARPPLILPRPALCGSMSTATAASPRC
jgi:glutathione S-transferase